MISATYMLTVREPSFMCDTSSPFPLGPTVYVSAGLLRAWRLQRYWLLNLFTCPTVIAILFIRGSGRNWPAGLVSAGCLVVGLRLWQPLHPFRNSTQVTFLDTLASSLSVSRINSYSVLGWSKHHLLLGRLILHQHLQDMKCCLGRNNLSATQCFECKRSSEIWETKHNLELLIVPLKTIVLQLYVSLLQPVSTLSLSRYTVHTKESHTSQSNRAGKISFASLPFHPYWL
jgi:hypothetical protein